MDDLATKTDVYWITRRDQIEALASPVRMALIDHLSRVECLSADTLATVLDLKTTAVYHHLKILLNCNLVEDAGQTWSQGARKPTKLYRTPARRMRLKRAFENPDNAGLLKDCHGAILRQAERDFATGFHQRHPSVGDAQRTHGFFRQVARMDPDRLRKLNQHLAQIAELLWEDDAPDGVPVAFTWSLTPIPEKTKDQH